MISQFITRGVLSLKATVTKVVVTLKVFPNVLTITSLLPTLLATYNLAEGRLAVAGLWIIASGFLDVIDGPVARSIGQDSPFGAVLDSITDRIADALIYIGAVLYFYRTEQQLYVIVTMVALAGALMVSYTRTRAENTVVDCKVGFAERGERLVIMLFALFFNKLGAGMWMLAGLSWLTTLQRVVHTRRALVAGQHRAPPEPG
jgi:CDP-diacylglycerol--glycerol-3-phosphate 3-phosphatidyltransferase